MVEMKVDASELKGDESKLVEKLADFLKEKTGGDTTTEGKIITVKGEGEALSKKYVKVTVKKFLHKHELSESFRVIGEEENTLKVKERKLSEED
ncbi:MAG: 60S ribosomal protein L22 [Candidatus Bathyarchaeota archaeon]|nr:60S ribosomal protein L22 [Candidatus Bathyarchaeota archaeon]